MELTVAFLLYLPVSSRHSLQSLCVPMYSIEKDLEFEKLSASFVEVSDKMFDELEKTYAIDSQ